MTTTNHTTATPPTTTRRLPGPDVVRAVALIGVVVMNFHGYLLLRRDTRGDDAVGAFFDPWTGPLATRFAATFVLVAGVGVTLFTRRAVGDRAAMTARRWTLVRRGLTLYGGGLLLDMVWPGTILPYYGAMFVLAALLCTWRTGWIVAAGAGAAVAGAAIAWWHIERTIGGHDTTWLFRPGAGSPRGLLFDVFVNGTHPLLPWLAFFCAGIVLGRMLGRPQLHALAIGMGLTLWALALGIDGLVDGGSRAELASTYPFDRSLVYTASALGTALLAYGAISWLAERHTGSAWVRVLGDAGAMSLTLYVAHALVFLLVVDRLGWVRSTGLDTALVFASGYWVAAIALGSWWHRRFGIGPAEWLYRKLGG
jgi:uncharacterized membrane protein YeiB